MPVRPPVLQPSAVKMVNYRQLHKFHTKLRINDNISQKIYRFIGNSYLAGGDRFFSSQRAGCASLLESPPE